MAPLVSLVILAVALIFEAGASVVAVQNPGAPLHALTAERREAMAWVDANLEPEAELAVITNSVWSGDPDSEWSTCSPRADRWPRFRARNGWARRRLTPR